MTQTATIPESERILRRLSASHAAEIDLTLDRFRDLLGRLGHPETRLGPVVHVAGTNGKGTFIACLRAILEAASYSVSSYVSPCLISVHDTIRTHGNWIAEDDLVRHLDRIAAAANDLPVTRFEAVTAAAFLAFAERRADIVLLECGMGGRDDATNVVPDPALSVITPISLDHQAYLGDTVADIAAAKAGIVKPGRPVLSAPQPGAAAAAIDRAARAAGSAQHGIPSWRLAKTGRSNDAMLTLDFPDGPLHLPRPALVGPQGRDGAVLAAAAARLLAGFDIGPDHVARGLLAVDHPGRLQRLRAGPLVAAVGPGAEIWLDGAHNPAAAARLCDGLDELDRLRAERSAPAMADTVLIAALGRGRDPGMFLEPLAANLAEVVAVPPPSGAPGPVAPEAIAAAARALGCRARLAATPRAALTGTPDRRWLIAGSLHLVGAVLGRDAYPETA